MFELRELQVAVIACMASSYALDELASYSGHAFRSAPDELLLVGPNTAGGEFERYAKGRLAGLDSHALVIDQTDGWMAWMLSGDDRAQAFARVSSTPLPSEPLGFCQGAVADLAAKVIAMQEGICVLVASTVGHNLRDRLVAYCADLGPQEGIAAPFPSVTSVGTTMSVGGAI